MRARPETYFKCTNASAKFRLYLREHRRENKRENKLWMPAADPAGRAHEYGCIYEP
jgi:hypothetical protein